MFTDYISHFLDNKYSKLYFKIIQKVLDEKRTKKRSTSRDYVYLEYHHILPASMFLEFEKAKWNIVCLTAREHFLCHYLLCKMVTEGSNEWHKLIRAFTFMYASNDNHGNHRYFNSKLYESARRNMGKIMSECQAGEKNSQFGTAWITDVNGHTLKIESSKLEEYFSKGYVRGRSYKEPEDKNTVSKRKMQRLETIKRKIADLTLEQEKLEREMGLTTGFEPAYSDLHS